MQLFAEIPALTLLMALALVIAFAAVAFVVVSVTWLRRLRATLGNALSETAGHQLRTSQRLADAITALQKQQKYTDQQIHNLAQANTRLRQELANMSQRLERNDDAHRGDRILH